VSPSPARSVLPAGPVSGRLLAVCLGITVLVCCVAGWQAWRSRERAAREEAIHLTGLASVHIDQLFRYSSLILDRYEQHLKVQPPAVIESAAIPQSLQAALNDEPGVRAFWLTSVDDRMIHGVARINGIESSTPPVELVNAAGPGVQRLREGKTGIQFGQPAVVGQGGQGGQGGRALLTLTRAIQEVPGGGRDFQGTVSVALDLATVETYLARLGRADGFAAAIIDSDGLILARFPRLAAIIHLNDDNPMMQAIRQGEVSGQFNRLSRVDGVTRSFAFQQVADWPVYVSYGTPFNVIFRGWLLDLAAIGASGTALYAAFVWLALLSARRRAREMLAAEVRFRTAQDLSRDAFSIFSPVRDESGTIIDLRWDYANTPARVIIPESEEIIGRRLLDLMPGNRDHPDLFPRYRQVIETGTGHTAELHYQADGLSAWFRYTAVPLGDGIAVAYHDISERKQAEQALKLLADEMAHRVRNLLATISAIVAQAGRTVPTVDLFRSELQARIQAMAQAQSLLVDADPVASADLAAIIGYSLAPYAGPGGDDPATASRWRLRGPAITVSPQAAAALNMAFHELATNAAKYGALSVSGGQVLVTWTPDPTELSLSWTESGGPPVSPPTRRGFGSQVVERSLVMEFGGRVSLLFPESGVQCLITVPLRPHFSPATAEGAAEEAANGKL
jgi:two-component sensor histidine kinase/PAS domain-containing protein